MKGKLIKFLTSAFIIGALLIPQTASAKLPI